jgi:hypothetical protein
VASEQQPTGASHRRVLARRSAELTGRDRQGAIDPDRPILGTGGASQETTTWERETRTWGGTRSRVRATPGWARRAQEPSCGR